MRRTLASHNVYDPYFMRRVKRTLERLSGAIDQSSTRAMPRDAFVDIDDRGAAWHVGHMRAAAVELARRVNDADFVLEIRDARLPFTTENPDLRRFARDKPRLIVFNKADLANEDSCRAVQRYYEANGAFALFTSARRAWRDTVEAIHKFATHALPAQPFRTTAHVGIVVGMPNVGKSTLINQARMAHEHEFHRPDMRRSRAPEPVSAMPGTTRALRLVPICRDPPVALYDTPGMTMAGNTSREASLKLAACGIIPTNQLTLPDALVARYIYDLLVSAGASEHLGECLRLPRAPVSFDDCVALICERSGRAAQTSLGNSNPFHAQKFIVHDFQLGRLGRLTLDRLPQRVHAHLHAAAAAEAADAAAALLEGGETSDGAHVDDDGSRRQRRAARGEGAFDADGDFRWTHDVRSHDVVARYPEHMRPVMEQLSRPVAQARRNGAHRSGAAITDQVISRKRGPISRATAYDESVLACTRLRQTTQ